MKRDDAGRMTDDGLLNLVDGHVPIGQSAGQLAAMPAAVRAFWILRNLELELTMGGLVAYFSNSAGIHANEASQALTGIGTVRSAALLTQAIPLGRGYAAAMPQRSEYEVTQPYLQLEHVERVDELGRDLYTTLYDEGFGAKPAGFLRGEIDDDLAVELRWPHSRLRDLLGTPDTRPVLNLLPGGRTHQDPRRSTAPGHLRAVNPTAQTSVGE